MFEHFISSAPCYVRRTMMLAAIISCALASPAIAGRSSYFNSMDETRSDNLTPFPKWTGTVKRFVKQQDIPDDQCDKQQYHPCVIKDWREMISGLQDKPVREQIKVVNKWGNDHPYIVDQLNWGMTDYWETPYEFMSINGDCEDYAIAKYYSLKTLGFTDEQMRIFVLQDYNLGGIIHAVLGVYVDDEILILDNQIKQVMAASRIYHYRPVYSINESWWWVYNPK